MSKLKKIDREFLLTDSTVNTYGFRLLTSGYLIDEYKKNPIGYYMHDRESGVLVKWDDLRIDGDKVYGKPVINMSNERAEQTVAEIENGFLNAASVGHLVALEYTDDSDQKLDGQTGPTVTKWFNRECSVVDVPGNMNAIALYDEFENPIQLADFSKIKLSKTNMKEIKFTAAQIAAMNLKADADDINVSTAFNELVAKAAKADGLQTQLNDLSAQVNKNKISDLLSVALAANKITKALSDKLAVDYATNPEGLKNLLSAMPGADGKVSEILSTALAAKKITQELSNKLAVDYKDNAEGLKNLVDTMPAYTSLTDALKEKTDTGKFTALMAKSFDDLMESGESEILKKQAPELYKQKYKEEFGHDPK